MVEPQEDLILKMVNHIKTSHSELNSLRETRSPYLAERAKLNLERVKNFQSEINNACDEVSQRITAIRKSIGGNIASHDNFDGFLLGDVDAYLEDFQGQVRRLNMKLE